MRERPKTAIQSQSGGRSQNILPFLRKTCWTPPPVPSAQHQTGEGPKLSHAFVRCRMPPHKESGGVLRKGHASPPQDAHAHHHSPPADSAETEEGRSPWYLSLLKEKEQSLLTLGREITRLSGFESECLRKDSEISALRERLQEETRQLRRTNENAVRAQAELILDLTEEVRRLRQADEELQQKNQHIAELQQEVTRVTEELTRVKEEGQLQKTHLREEAQTNMVRRTEWCSSGLPQEEAGVRGEGQTHLQPNVGEKLTIVRKGTELQKTEVQGWENQQRGYELQQEVTHLREEPSQWEDPLAEAGNVFITMQTDEGLESSLSEVPCDKGDSPRDGKGHGELQRAETKLIAALEATNQALMTELEEARANNRMSSGALCSMRRALSVKEQEFLTLKTEVENLRRDLKDRMEQVQAMSRKFSCMRDGRSRDELMRTLEKENYSMRQLVSRLQAELSEREESVSRLSRRLKAREQEAQQERVQRRRLAKEAQQQQEALIEMQASRTTTQAALEQTTSKYERLRMKVIQAVYSAAGSKAPQKEVTDAAIYYTMQKIIDDRSKFYQRLVQRGDKVPSLAISEPPPVRSGSIAASRRTSVMLGS